MERFKIRKS